MSVSYTIGVVIPYFQREPGLLTRALRSVFAQVGARADTVIVVDDGSPARARDDLVDFGEAERARITLVEQPNVGVSAARNRGLDVMPDTIDAIAFLDSDDAWASNHLENAISALRHGADIYFADYRRDGATGSRFEECGLKPDLGTRLPVGAPIHWFEGDLFAAILRKSPVGTPTVVFRRDAAPKLRFHEGLSAGEDNLFWMSLARSRARAAFGTEIETECGKGVNIFASVAWGNPKALNMLLNTERYLRLAAKLFPLSPDLAALNMAFRRQVRRDFALNFLHLVRHQRGMDWRTVWGFIQLEPAALAEVVTALIFRRRSNHP